MTSPQSLEALQRDHAVPGAATWEAGPGGLPSLVVRTEQCEARLFTHGAHVASWTPLLPAGPDGRAPPPVPGLHLSPKSAFDPKKAIRGGVPVCFPWFGPRTDDPRVPLDAPADERKPSPAHGFARTTPFTVDSVALEDNGRVRVEMSLVSDARTKALWDADFEASLVVTLGHTLGLSFEVRNTGDAELEYELALHTYLEVGDVERVQVLGLEGTKYFDKVAATHAQTGREPLVFTGETDSVFQNTKSAVTVVDPVLSRHLRIEKTGSLSTVVWNPWLVKAQAMPDVGGEAWRNFVCVEAGNVRPHHVVLPKGAVHTTSTRVSVIPQR